MNEVQSIKLIISEMINLLEEFDLTYWSTAFKRFLTEIDSNFSQVKHDILRNYAGMGSFNDIVLEKNGEYPLYENDKFTKLRNDLYDLCLV